MAPDVVWETKSSGILATENDLQGAKKAVRLVPQRRVEFAIAFVAIPFIGNMALIQGGVNADEVK